MSVSAKIIQDLIQEIRAEYTEDLRKEPIQDCLQLNIERLKNIRQPYTNLGTEVLISRELLMTRIRKLQDMMIKIPVQKTLAFYGEARLKQLHIKLNHIKAAIADVKSGHVELIAKIEKAKVIDPEIVIPPWDEDGAVQSINEASPTNVIESKEEEQTDFSIEESDLESVKEFFENFFSIVDVNVEENREKVFFAENQTESESAISSGEGTGSDVTPTPSGTVSPVSAKTQNDGEQLPKKDEKPIVQEEGYAQPHQEAEQYYTPFELEWTKILDRLNPNLT